MSDISMYLLFVFMYLYFFHSSCKPSNQQNKNIIDINFNISIALSSEISIQKLFQFFISKSPTFELHGYRFFSWIQLQIFKRLL